MLIFYSCQKKLFSIVAFVKFCKGSARWTRDPETSQVARVSVRGGWAERSLQPRESWREVLGVWKCGSQYVSMYFLHIERDTSGNVSLILSVRVSVSAVPLPFPSWPHLGCLLFYRKKKQFKNIWNPTEVSSVAYTFTMCFWVVLKTRQFNMLELSSAKKMQHFWILCFLKKNFLWLPGRVCSVNIPVF